jgi:hypothetical protein
MNLKPIAILIALLFTSCTIIPTQHGKAQFWGDYSQIYFHDGSVTFSANTAIHSTAIRAHWHGVTTLGMEAMTYGLGGAGPAVGVGGATISNFVNRPTSRTKPLPGQP